MTPQDEREAIIADVRLRFPRWNPTPAMLGFARACVSVALRQPGAEYRRAVEDAARVCVSMHQDDSGSRDPWDAGWDRALNEAATAICALTDAKEVGGG